MHEGRRRRLAIILGMKLFVRVRRVAVRAAGVIAGTCVVAGALRAQVASGASAAPAPKEDHRAVIEVGLAGERGIGESATSVGGTIAVEMTPVENWLELEAGVAAVRGGGHTGHDGRDRSHW